MDARNINIATAAPTVYTGRRVFGRKVSRGSSRANWAICSHCGADTRAKISGEPYRHARGGVESASECPGGRAIETEHFGGWDTESATFETAAAVAAARRGLAALIAAMRPSR
jgi:hypothetical protein